MSNTAAAGAPPSPLSGDWTGALTAPTGAIIPLGLHVADSADGWTATLDSPEQGALGLHARSVTQQGRVVSIRFAVPRATYTATLSPDGGTLAGTWSQGAGTLPLVMTRAASATERPVMRMQTPRPPFPYRSENVRYDNDIGHAHLAGTLTLPAGPGPFPAVLLITGSGLQDRDETLFGHKPFLV
ncbi:hypothetical protein [Gluconacetobacter sacchari]|nr:hypothetical protein [Gluconacetobacter sacchari]